MKAYYEHRADMIVAEVNNGGEMVEAVLRSVDENVPFKAVRAMRVKVRNRPSRSPRCTSRARFTTLATSRSSRNRCACSPG